jgi:hypothetical protein
MADQPDLFTRTRPGDPDTSHEAAAKIAPRMTALQVKVLTYMREIFPRAITDLDLQDHFNNDLSTYRTRRSELTEMGLVYDTRQRRFQLGSNRVLWRAVPWSDETAAKLVEAELKVIADWQARLRE